MNWLIWVTSFFNKSGVKQLLINVVKIWAHVNQLGCYKMDQFKDFPWNYIHFLKVYNVIVDGVVYEKDVAVVASMGL